MCGSFFTSRNQAGNGNADENEGPELSQSRGHLKSVAWENKHGQT